ncbi:MAG TPA: M23 family metallopeptidase [Allosphingosinicella sp.]|jgi:murein DD-endopeptidase MepM/ murein hydrolase activator NlpD
MPDRDDFSPSFDPKTWRANGSKETGSGPAAPEAGDAGSFDPRSWGSEGSAPPREAGPPSLRLGAALTAAALILLAGAGAAWLGREERTAPAPVKPQAEAAPSAAPAGERHRTITVAGASEIAAALRAAGLDEASATRAAAAARGVLGGAPGGLRLAFTLAEDGATLRLAALEATREDGSGVRLAEAQGRLAAERLDARLALQLRAVAGEMDETSFYSSAVSAGVPDSVISDFATAFSFDLDFQREVRPGDRFEAVLEQARNPAGEAVGAPRLLFVAMRTNEKSLRFYRFRPPGGEEGWFDDGGRSNVRSLMRTPLDGARVSSRFGYRIHPLFGVRRLHRGTDFAAPVGTRVYAAADGEVASAGPNRCAGNMIRLRHDNGWTTHYFHLSAFAPQIAAGARVRQGEVIGAVGNTGTCTTGPHLHFELLIDGEHTDALGIDTGAGTVLAGAAKAAFNSERDRIDRSRAELR